MKKLLLIMISVFSLNALCMFGMETEKEEIPLKEDVSEDRDKVRPRMPLPIPLLCYYDNGVVSLELLANLGEVNLTVTNQTTGEQWSTKNNWVLQTSTVAGVYLVEIITEDGTTYWGTYTL